MAEKRSRAEAFKKKILGPIFICGQQLWILYETKKVNFLKKNFFMIISDYKSFSETQSLVEIYCHDL